MRGWNRVLWAPAPAGEEGRMSLRDDSGAGGGQVRSTAHAKAARERARGKGEAHDGVTRRGRGSAAWSAVLKDEGVSDPETQASAACRALQGTAAFGCPVV